jgi:uncharacterized protein (DUF885 family)
VGFRFVLAVCAAAIISVPAAARQGTPGNPPAAVTQLADEFVAASMERWPEMATFLGVPDAQHARVFDNSPAAKAAWDKRIDGFQARLTAIGRGPLAGRPEAITYGFLEQALSEEIGLRSCQAELWGVDQMNGWQVTRPAFLQRQPVATEADRKAALERLAQYPAFIDREIATLQRGLAAGYSAPRVSVDRVIGQIEALAASDPDKSPFAAPAARTDDAAFKRAVTETIAKQINPALARYRSFLGEYQTVARTTVGVAELPNGAACYRGLMRAGTTLDLSADELHQLGLTLMEQIHGEMRTIAQRSFNTSDVPALLERLRSDPALRFKSGDEIMARSTDALARARAAMPKYFGRLPKADVRIEPFADFEAVSAPPAMYRQSSLDGTSAGMFMVNLLKPQETPRADIEAVAYHEAIPGHHLQLALAIERPAAHMITQLFFSGAFVEGWGLYAERLADEMGLYSSDLDRMGMLSAAAWRAARLVVDTGLHAKKWSRQQAVDYLRRNTAIGDVIVQNEVDRYIIMPGQALAYMVGYREIMSLRAKAQAALGAKFDIRAFHDAVLGRGGVTLPMLREQIEEWMLAQK